MTWQGDEARVSDMAQGQPSRRAEFQPSVTSQAKPTLHATSICHVIIIHDMYTPTSTPPSRFFFFFPLFSSPSNNPISFSYHADLKDRYHNIPKD